jgi:hypothetical protein
MAPTPAVPGPTTSYFRGDRAAFGALLALAFELTGHPWWALLMLLTCALGLSLVRTIWDFRGGI